MSALNTMKERIKPTIGIYSVGLKAYWDQFPGLKERIIGYGKFIERRLSDVSEVSYHGIADDVSSARKIGDDLVKINPDLIFVHAATYVTSAAIMPVHQRCQAPVVVLNLQPAARIDYERMTTGEWLANCNACVVPEISNAFHRNDMPFHMVSGVLGMDEGTDGSLSDENTSDRLEAIRAWKEIEDWVRAAMVKRNLRESTFGYLGNVYGGMLDLYTDITRIQAQTGAHIEMLEMCDFNEYFERVTDAMVKEKRKEIAGVFEISEDIPADPIAKKPTEEQLEWSARVAAAQESMVKDLNLAGLSYYYHGRGRGTYEELQSGFIAGHSLLTAKGIPCSGEGDLKTLIAMKISDLLGVGGSFSEIVTVDYDDQTILVGHDGPFHLRIANGKPILRGMGLYHGKRGSGVSVEAKVVTGPVTTLNITDQNNGKIKMIIGEGISTDGPIMRIGNTQTPVRFKTDPDTYMKAWFSEHPSHHFALSVGHNAKVLEKVAILYGWDVVNLVDTV